SVTALVVATTAVAAFFDDLAWRGSDARSAANAWSALASLRILIAPLFALAFLLSAVMAPSRSSRLALLVATAIEASVFVWVAFIWFHPFQSPCRQGTRSHPDAEVTDRDLLVGCELCGLALEDLCALIEDDDAIGERQRGVDVLFDQEHRQTLALEATQHLDDGLEHERGESLRRLVQQDQRGVGHQGPADGEHLLLAAREVAPEPAPQLSQPRKASKHVVDGPRPRAAPDDLEVFLGAQRREDPPVRGHVGDAPAGHQMGG